MEYIKTIELDPDTVEVQLWSENRFIGAGSFTKPVDYEYAKKVIIANWLCS